MVGEVDGQGNDKKGDCENEEEGDGLRVEMYGCDEPNSGSKDSEEEGLYEFIKVDRKTDGARKSEGARMLNFQHYKDLLISKQTHSNSDKEQ